VCWKLLRLECDTKIKSTSESDTGWRNELSVMVFGGQRRPGDVRSPIEAADGELVELHYEAVMSPLKRFENEPRGYSPCSWFCWTNRETILLDSESKRRPEMSNVCTSGD
jgi:hypothetical protein